jgi:hypothetical protein
MAQVGKERITLSVPRGYTCGTDTYGVFIANSAGDVYHFTSDEVLGGMKTIIAGLKAMLSRRALEKRSVKEAARKQKDDTLLLKEIGTIYVCLQDSVRSGNCLAGSLAWARQHGIDPNAHIAASMLELFAAKEPRVTRVIKAARIRSLQEIKQGYSLLAEHRL